MLPPLSAGKGGSYGLEPPRHQRLLRSVVPFYLQRMDEIVPKEATGLSVSITDTNKAYAIPLKKSEDIMPTGAE